MKLPIEWAETLRRLEKEFPEAVIAGGAPLPGRELLGELACVNGVH